MRQNFIKPYAPQVYKNSSLKPLFFAQILLGYIHKNEVTKIMIVRQISFL